MGSDEISVREVRQIRQEAGNKTEKTLAAAE